MRTYVSMRRRSEFGRVQRRGRRRSGRYLVVLSTPRAAPTSVGIAVAKAVGNAVVRNRVRRRIKALLDRHGAGQPPFRALLIVARKGAGEASFAALAADLEKLL
jgi:ribonuclease P protein component